jgi:hypothetical protein
MSKERFSCPFMVTLPYGLILCPFNLPKRMKEDDRSFGITTIAFCTGMWRFTALSVKTAIYSKIKGKG